MAEQHHKTEEASLAGLAAQIGDHVEARMEYTRLSLYEKGAIALVKSTSAGIALKLSALVLFFISVAAGCGLGEYYHDYAIGFGIIAAAYMVLLLLFLVTRKSVFEKRMLDAAITALCAEEEEEEDDEED